MSAAVPAGSVVTGPSSLRARFQRGVTWNVAGSVVAQASTFFANVILANLLGKEIFGQFGMVQSTVLTLSGIAQIATSTTATRYISEFRASNKERAGRILGLCSTVTLLTGVLATIGMIAAAPWLAVHALKAPQLARALELAAGMVLFSVMNGYQIGALSGLESYRSLALASGCSGLCHITIISLLTWRLGFTGAVLGLALVAFARWAIFLRFTWREAEKQEIKLSYHNVWRERQIILNFAVPAALTSLSAAPAIWLANTFLVRTAGGYSQMALYTVANSLKTVVLFLPLLLNNVGMSMLNNQRGEGSATTYRKVFWANMAAGVGCTLGAVAVLALFGRKILQMYGHGFTDAYPVLLLLLTAAVMEIVGTTSYQVVQSEEKMWISLFFIALPRDLLLVLLAHRFTAHAGATGLATAQLASSTLYGVVVVFIVYNLGLKVRQKAVLSA